MAKATFEEALEAFCKAWSQDKIREMRLSWRCGEALELAGKRLAPEILGECGLSDAELREKIHRAFGAPGDFGYGTPEGDSLRRLYEVEVQS